MAVILHPDRVLIVRPGLPNQILAQVDAISTVGGSQLKADKRFDFGWRNPKSVGVVARGEKRHLDGVELVLIQGGKTAEKSSAASPVLLGGGGNSQRMIVDDGGIGLGQIENLKKPSLYIDEVDKYLNDKSKAHHQVGGDDFYTFVKMNENAQSDAHAAAAFVRTNPSSIMQGMLGKNIPAVPISTTSGQGLGYDTANPYPGFDLSAAILNSQSVASWSAPDEECTNVVCTFGQFTNANIPVGSAGFRPYGIIQWGVAGLLCSAIVDIGRGTMFQIAASSVMLSVGMESGQQGPLPSPNVWTTLNLGAFISMGRISHQASVTRTIYSNPIFTATPTLIYIPPFAKSVSLMIAGSTTALTANICNATSDFSPPSPQWAQFLLAVGQTSVLNIPLPGDTVAISVATTAGPDVFGCLVFNLGLG